MDLFPFIVGNRVVPSGARPCVAGCFLGLEHGRTGFLPPTDIQSPECVHPETFKIDSCCFGGRPEHVLLKVSIIGRLAVPIVTSEYELISSLAGSEMQQFLSKAADLSYAPAS